MRSNKHLVLTLIVLIIVAALYRIIPERPFGFAPQWAMCLFAGAVIRDKKWAFAIPVFSLFISDLIYQLLYIKGLSSMPGFYSGQITNYLLFAGMTIIGFFMKKINVANVVLYSLIICSAFFLLSNYFVWSNNAGFFRPHTFNGLILTYMDGLPFFGYSILSTLMFSAVLFGGWKLITAKKNIPALAAKQ
jgi:hypothetical protein